MVVCSTSFRNPCSGLVRSMESVKVLAIRRSGSDEWVRAKILIEDGEQKGSIFITRQIKTQDTYSSPTYSPEEIEAMTKADALRDSTLSPKATVIAKIEHGRLHVIDQIPLLEPEPFDPVKRLPKTKR